MSTNHEFPMKLVVLLAWMGGALSAGAVAGWGVSKYTESSELESYRRAKEWNAREAIDSISKLSSTASLAATERAELFRLQARERELELTVSSQSAQYRDSMSKLQAEKASSDQALMKRIESLEAQNHDLAEVLSTVVLDNRVLNIEAGSSQFVIEGSLAIGVGNVYVGFADINIGNRRVNMRPGQQEYETIGGHKYAITLLQISNKGCSLSFGRLPE